MRELIGHAAGICHGTGGRHFAWFARLLESHMDGICAHALHPVTSGKVEGANNMIKTLRRKHHGLPDDEYLFLRIMDASRKKQRWPPSTPLNAQKSAKSLNTCLSHGGNGIMQTVHSAGNPCERMQYDESMRRAGAANSECRNRWVRGGIAMMKADIHDVARAAGVSISTVSRSFTHPEMVSEQTRRRVLEVASRMGYAISRSAGAIKTGRTNRVALLMNESITSWFNVNVFAGINRVLHAEGYDIAIWDHIDKAADRHEFFETLPVRRNVDAVFVASFATDETEVAQLRSIHVPLIGINTPSAESLDASIGIDDREGMATAARHLIALGHRSLAYVGSEPAASLGASIDDRQAGFERACADAQAAGKDLSWQVIRVPRGAEFVDVALSELLALEEFPDAICCQIDMLTIPLMRGLAKYGRVAPRDYSIIGFDDHDMAEMMDLTTMRQEPCAMGRAAAGKALALMSGQPLAVPHETLHAQLVLRGTDAPYHAA